MLMRYPVSFAASPVIVMFLAEFASRVMFWVMFPTFTMYSPLMSVFIVMVIFSEYVASLAVTSIFGVALCTTAFVVSLNPV